MFTSFFGDVNLNSPFWDNYPIICSFIVILGFAMIIPYFIIINLYGLLGYVLLLFQSETIIDIWFGIGLILYFSFVGFFLICLEIFFELECLEIEWGP